MLRGKILTNKGKHIGGRNVLLNEFSDLKQVYFTWTDKDSLRTVKDSSYGFTLIRHFRNPFIENFVLNIQNNTTSH